MSARTRMFAVAVALGLAAGCEVVDAVGGAFDDDCAFAVPLFEPYSGASDPDCTGIAVKPRAGEKKKHKSWDNVWVVTTLDPPGKKDPRIECTFYPHSNNCYPEWGAGQWSVILSGDNQAIGTSYECLCADVECISLETGELIREWTWELGSCAD